MENNNQQNFWKIFFAGFISAFFIGAMIFALSTLFPKNDKELSYDDGEENSYESFCNEKNDKERCLNGMSANDKKDKPLTKKQTDLLNEPIVQKNIEFYKEYNKVKNKLYNSEFKYSFVKLTNFKIKRDPSINEDDVRGYDYQKDREYLITDPSLKGTYFTSKKMADELNNLLGSGQPIYAGYKETQDEYSMNVKTINKIYSNDYMSKKMEQEKEFKKEIVKLRDQNNKQGLNTDLEKFVYDYLKTSDNVVEVDYFKNKYKREKEYLNARNKDISILDYINFNNYSLINRYGDKKFNDKMEDLIHISREYNKKIDGMNVSIKKAG